MAEAMLKKMLTDSAGQAREIKVSSAAIAPNARDGSDITQDVKWLLKLTKVGREDSQVAVDTNGNLRRHTALRKQ